MRRTAMLALAGLVAGLASLPALAQDTAPPGAGGTSMRQRGFEPRSIVSPDVSIKAAERRGVSGAQALAPADGVRAASRVHLNLPASERIASPNHSALPADEPAK